VTRSRRIFALSNLDPRCRQQDQALKERAQRAVTIRNLPKTFPMAPLAALCSPATVIDKTRYSAFADPG
jgi:hypothetical protein